MKEDIGSCNRFVKEYFGDKNRGYGQQIVEVFHKLRVQKFIDPYGPAKEQFEGTGSYGNGAAMRTAPIALFCHKNYEELLDTARKCAELTHTHKQGYNGAILQMHQISWRYVRREAWLHYTCGEDKWKIFEGHEQNYKYRTVEVSAVYVPDKIIYHQALLVSLVDYRTSAWAQQIRNVRVKRKIRSLWRSVLLKLSGALVELTREGVMNGLQDSKMMQVPLQAGAIYNILRNVNRWSLLDAFAGGVLKRKRNRYVLDMKNRRQNIHDNEANNRQMDRTDDESDATGSMDSTLDVDDMIQNWYKDN
uniref:ADP-ribosylhydrolase ARH3 n=1 Tax=Timema poppense TaxID=170557 RepID=A0A7R9CPH1_TIMPO|nr:unnamed protein product [Timema poppensis]